MELYNILREVKQYRYIFKLKQAKACQFYAISNIGGQNTKMLQASAVMLKQNFMLKALKQMYLNCFSAALNCKCYPCSGVSLVWSPLGSHTSRQLSSPTTRLLKRTLCPSWQVTGNHAKIVCFSSKTAITKSKTFKETSTPTIDDDIFLGFELSNPAS